MTSRQKYVLLLTMCVVFFALGRWSTPTKTKIVTQTVETEKKTDEAKTHAAVDRHEQTVQVSVKKPDGTVTTTTTTVEDDHARRSSDDKAVDNLAETTTSTKEVTRGGSSLTIGALAGARLSLSAQPLQFGGFAFKSIAGPFGVGVWGLNAAPGVTGGLAIGVSF